MASYNHRPLGAVGAGHLLDDRSDAALRTVFPHHNLGWTNIDAVYSLVQQTAQWTCRQPVVIADMQTKHLAGDLQPTATKPQQDRTVVESSAGEHSIINSDTLRHLLKTLLDYADVDCLRCLADREDEIANRIIVRIPLLDIIDTINTHRQYKSATTDRLWLTYLHHFFSLSTSQVSDLNHRLYGITLDHAPKVQLFWDCTRLDDAINRSNAATAAAADSIWHKIELGFRVHVLDLSEQNVVRLLQSADLEPEAAIKLTITSVILNPDRSGTAIARARSNDCYYTTAGAATAAAPAGLAAWLGLVVYTPTQIRRWKQAAEAHLQWWVNPGHYRIEFAFFFQMLWHAWLPGTALPPAVRDLWGKRRDRWKRVGLPSPVEIRNQIEWEMREGQWIPVFTEPKNQQRRRICRYRDQ